MKPLPYAEFVRFKMIELRKTKALSQKDFGEVLGLSTTNISALELAKHEWSLTHMSTAIVRFGLPRSFFNVEEQPADDGAAAELKQSMMLLHKIAGLPPAGKTAIYKYSLLDDERRGIIDKMIAAAKHADLAVFRAVLALLRQAFK